MAITRIGLKAPADYAQGEDNLHYAYSDDTGTCAEVTECSDGVGYIVETWNDAAGVTTYWRATTMAEAIAFCDEVTA